MRVAYPETLLSVPASTRKIAAQGSFTGMPVFENAPMIDALDRQDASVFERHGLVELDPRVVDDLGEVVPPAL